MGNTLFNEYLEDLQKLITINSVKSTPQVNAPYGEGVERAFSYVKQLAESFGFHVSHLDHKVLIVDFSQQKFDEYIGVFSHIDLVSVEDTDRWVAPPFAGEIKNDRMYGRGTLDNKGPTLAILYAMKQLKDQGFRPRKGIRLVIGGDEESGMNCLQTYREKMPAPVFGFTPAAYFPVTTREQGIMTIEVKLPLSNQTAIDSVEVGFSSNVKPQSGSYTVHLSENQTVETIEQFEGVQQVDEFDVPQRVNVKVLDENREAITIVTNHLRTLFRRTEAETEKSVTLIQSLLLDESGESLALDCRDEDGELTMKATRLLTEEERLTVTLDLRYPASFTEEVMKEKLDQGMKQQDLDYTIENAKPPVHFDTDHSMVQQLLEVYEEVTGRSEKPAAISGGTYARIYPDRVIAFGAVYPGEPVTAHQTNESVPLYMMKDWLLIYEKAIRKLSQ